MYALWNNLPIADRTPGGVEIHDGREVRGTCQQTKAETFKQPSSRSPDLVPLSRFVPLNILVPASRPYSLRGNQPRHRGPLFPFSPFAFSVLPDPVFSGCCRFFPAILIFFNLPIVYRHVLCILLGRQFTHLFHSYPPQTSIYSLLSFSSILNLLPSFIFHRP